MVRRQFAKLFVGAFMALTACTTTPVAELTERRATSAVVLPTMNTFATLPAPGVTRTNTSVASDFMALAFQLESGRRLPVLSRFDGPVSVRVTGRPPPSLAPDLARLLTRLQAEAGLTIRQVKAAEPANITIEVVPGGALQRSVPNAACFVAPRVSSWGEFRATRRLGMGDWTTLTERTRMAIFLPTDVSPQEVRDCLHEELAQALGPVNDLYHLADSVFNDDNFHTVLTGFDMLVLRAFYAPELHSGMPPEQVAALLPAILARLNPAGGPVHGAFPINSPKSWKDALNGALTGKGGAATRRRAALQAVNIARAQGWQDNRLAFSLFVLGRLSLSSNGALALASFLQAGEIYASHPETQLHAAHVAVQTAAYSLSSRQPQAAVDLVNAHFSAALAAENASLLATLLMIKAQALEALGKDQEARVIRLDSLGWARYGFGSDQEVRRRLSEIAALSPTIRKASRQ